MKSFFLAIFVSTFAAPQAQCSTYRNLSSQELMREFFGKEMKDIPEPVTVDLGVYSVRTGVELNCGNLDLNIDYTDFLENFSKALQSIEALAKNIINPDKKLSGALAFLTLCYMNPQMCDQLKNFNFNFTADLQRKMDICHHIDRTISESARKGAQMNAEALGHCVNRKIQGGMKKPKALEECNESNKMKEFKNFAAKLEEKFYAGPQKVLESILGFSDSSDYYSSLAPLLGEVTVEGGVYKPSFPGGKMLPPHSAVRSFQRRARDTICDVSTLKRFVSSHKSPRKKDEAALASVIAAELDSTDVENLQSLTERDRQHACSALSEAVAKEAGKQFAVESRSAMSAGLLNPNLPSDLKEDYENRVEKNLGSFEAQMDARRTPSVSEVLSRIRELAAATRAHRSKDSAQMSRDTLAVESEKRTQKLRCDDEISCSMGGTL